MSLSFVANLAVAETPSTLASFSTAVLKFDADDETTATPICGYVATTVPPADFSWAVDAAEIDADLYTTT